MTQRDAVEAQAPDGPGPASLAVALEVDGSSGHAPRVTALGRGSFAKQLLEIAHERGVKVRRDADLAEILSALGVDSPIPPDAFGAVAEILAHLYQADREAAPERGEMMSEWLKNDDEQH